MAEMPEGKAAHLSAEEVARLAEYAALDLPAERAALLAPLLGGTLEALRALRPDDYDDLQPAITFQIPREP